MSGAGGQRLRGRGVFSVCGVRCGFWAALPPVRAPACPINLFAPGKCNTGQSGTASGRHPPLIFIYSAAGAGIINLIRCGPGLVIRSCLSAVAHSSPPPPPRRPRRLVGVRSLRSRMRSLRSRRGSPCSPPKKTDTASDPSETVLFFLLTVHYFRRNIAFFIRLNGISENTKTIANDGTKHMTKRITNLIASLKFKNHCSFERIRLKATRKTL